MNVRFVEALSDVLECRGWTVFGDRDVRPGDDFANTVSAADCPGSWATSAAAEP